MNVLGSEESRRKGAGSPWARALRSESNWYASLEDGKRVTLSFSAPGI